jgi:restriction system protein
MGSELGVEALEHPTQRTIVEAIQSVLRSTGLSMTVSEISRTIIEQALYHFRTPDPENIVRAQIRRHCKGIDFASAAARKFFEMSDPGRYALLARPTRESDRKPLVSKSQGVGTTVQKVRRVHEAYTAEFRKRIVRELMTLDPGSFERFCRNLLRAYGFRDVQVTRICKDGGIDGFGQLKVGFAYFNVAFQCKRWKGNVGRAEVSQFRGDIQGQYETGIFFTTARFTLDAKAISMRVGAVPVILVDGATIVEIMIEKQFGIEKEDLPLYRSAMDLALAD